MLRKFLLFLSLPTLLGLASPTFSSPVSRTPPPILQAPGEDVVDFFFVKVHETFFNNSRAVLRGSSWSQSYQKFSSAWKIHQLCTRNKFSLLKMAHEFRAPRLRSRACARRKTREDIFKSFCPITAFFYSKSSQIYITYKFHYWTAILPALFATDTFGRNGPK